MPISPILAIHICAGLSSLLSGTVAISVRKGSRTHGISGIVFSVSMLILATSGAYVAYIKSQTGNLLAGFLTFYMVATAWAAARRRDKVTATFDWAALLTALVIAASCFGYGFKVAQGTGSNDGVPAGMEFFFGSVILLAAVGDFRALVRSLSGTQRIARHLWRMCFALFIASGSFFMGRQQIFPEFVRKSNVLLLLTILPLILLIFWLIRVRLTKAYHGGWLLPARNNAQSLPT